jgi:hypothetical protein
VTTRVPFDAKSPHITARPFAGGSVRIRHRQLQLAHDLAQVVQRRFGVAPPATAGGRRDRAKELEIEINGLLREKEEIERWAVVESA